MSALASRSTPALGLPDREGAIDPHSGRRTERLDQSVQRGALVPLRCIRRRSSAVDGGDGRLGLKGTWSAGTDRAVQELGSTRDRVAVPARSVLSRHWDRVSVLVHGGMLPLRSSSTRRSALAIPTRTSPPAKSQNVSASRPMNLWIRALKGSLARRRTCSVRCEANHDSMTLIAPPAAYGIPYPRCRCRSKTTRSSATAAVRRS